MTQGFLLAEVPLYLRAGAIMPMQPPMRYTGETPVDPLIVRIAPRTTDGMGAYTLYEDSGQGRAYQTGACATTRLHATWAGAEVRVCIDPAAGAYPGMLKERAYTLELLSDWPPETVTVNGEPLRFVARDEVGWRYDGNRLTTIIRTKRFSTEQPVEIRVQRQAELVVRRKELNGLVGVLARLRAVYDKLNQTWPAGWSPDSLIDAMQIGTRLRYHPERAGVEVEHFAEVMPQAIVDIERQGLDEAGQHDLAARLGADVSSDVVQKRVAQLTERFTQAHALMQAAAAATTMEYDRIRLAHPSGDYEGSDV